MKLFILIPVLALSFSAHSKSDLIFLADDIVITQEEEAGLIRAGSGFTYYWSNPWKNGVLPVQFDSDITENQRTQFMRTCEIWGEFAFVQCVSRTKERTYLFVQKSDKGCWSMVGTSKLGGRRKLNLAPACWTHRVILHEIGHALGLLHEHQRPDRDQYVQIKTENIKKDSKYAFDKVTSAISHISDYDFLSIMHYRATAFTKNGKNTIVANPEFGVTAIGMGTHQELSNSDHEVMISIYGERR